MRLINYSFWNKYFFTLQYVNGKWSMCHKQTDLLLCILIGNGVTYIVVAHLQACVLENVISTFALWRKNTVTGDLSLVAGQSLIHFQCFLFLIYSHFAHPSSWHPGQVFPLPPLVTPLLSCLAWSFLSFKSWNIEWYN